MACGKVVKGNYVSCAPNDLNSNAWVFKAGCGICLMKATERRRGKRMVAGTQARGERSKGREDGEQLSGVGTGRRIEKTFGKWGQEGDWVRAQT